MPVRHPVGARDGLQKAGKSPHLGPDTVTTDGTVFRKSDARTIYLF